MRANRGGVDAGRRVLLTGALAGLALAASPGWTQDGPRLIERPAGGYRLLPGGPVFAGGAVAAEGFEVVHAVLKPWLPLEDGYALVEAHLAALGRPMQAMCGLELRLPRQLSMDEFRAFNQPYVERLVRWGLLFDGVNPVCRTNVAPAVEPPEVPSLHGFSYTVPSQGQARTFVMSGITELGPGGPVAAGETSNDAMREKLRYVLRAVSGRLAALGVALADATQVEVYAVHGAEILADVLMPAIEEPARRGLRWHYGRPPVSGTEIELEARSVGREIVLRA